MTDLIFYQDKPTQLGEESKRMARGHAIAKLIARHEAEFAALLQFEEEDMLYAALHAMQNRPTCILFDRGEPAV